MTRRKNHIPGYIPALALFFIVLYSSPAPADWLQFNGNPQHDGNNREEKVITKEKGILILESLASGDFHMTVNLFISVKKRIEGS